MVFIPVQAIASERLLYTCFSPFCSFASCLVNACGSDAALISAGVFSARFCLLGLIVWNGEGVGEEGGCGKGRRFGMGGRLIWKYVVHISYRNFNGELGAVLLSSDL